MDLHLRHEVDRVLETPGESAARLANDLMVDFLMACGFVRSSALESALRAQPRHHFLPGVDLRTVYQDRAVTTAYSENGWFDSSCSTPSVVSLMTEALEIAEDSRILEIGSGTGWTAALMAEMAPRGTVTTLEVLPDLAAASRLRLEERFGDRVELRCADGSNGSAGPGPYDRIIFACGATEIPLELTDMLVEGGRLVIPIGHFVHVLVKRAGAFVGGPVAIASFIAFRSGKPTARWHVDGHQAVLLAEDQSEIAGLLGLDRAEFVEGPELDPARLESLNFWLALHEPERSLLFADRDGGWGFGLVAEDGLSAAAIFCRGEFTFRHHEGPVQETRIAVWGGDEAGESLFAICSAFAELDWPRLVDFEERIGGSTEAESLLRTRLGALDWRLDLAPAAVR